MKARALILKKFYRLWLSRCFLNIYKLNCVQAKNFGALTLLSHNKTNYNHLAKGSETEAQKRQILWFDRMIFMESRRNLSGISDGDNKLEH
jgi:hypothetical protein